MYTLDLDGQPFAVVNLPRHEAQDFFDESFPWCTNLPQAFTFHAQFVTRLASRAEKLRLVQAYKQSHAYGLVKQHHFDGYCTLLMRGDRPSAVSGLLASH